MTEKNSILLRMMSSTKRFSIIPIKDEPDISDLSFKHWHKRMQQDHELQSGKTFWLWKWCRTGCKPCRWFDTIDYDKKICKFCLKFRTFKSLGTLVLIAVFFYIFMYSVLKEELLPGGTVFFIFLLCLIAYLAGYVLMYAGMPPMIGHLIVGLTFGNLPAHCLPNYDSIFLLQIARILEKLLLVLALIRAGLLLDLAQIKNSIMFILRVSLLPLLAEFFLLWVSCHFLLKLPWNWSALQGSVLCIVSLASVTSVMEKNRQMGYGEDKHLSTVLIAASALCVVFASFLYFACLCFVFPSIGYNTESIDTWKILLNLLEQMVLGLATGAIAGLLISFFPDKRNSEAAVLRIVVIGIGSLAMGNIFNESNMMGAGVLSCITMCIIAANMWEELGWHQKTNPVQYFYTLMYYFGQPPVLSLIGFTMNFRKTNSKEVGLSVAIIIIGIIGRESVCFAMTLGNLYPTTLKEKIFICIAWFSKGTFQALLAFATGHLTIESDKFLDEVTIKHFVEYSRFIKQTTILAIMLTTPLAYYALTLLTPVLLTKKEQPPSSPVPSRSTDGDTSEPQVIKKVDKRKKANEEVKEPG